MLNYQKERHKKWLHHSVIKWTEAFLCKEEISSTKVLTLTFFFLVTAVSTNPSLQETNLSKQPQSVDTTLSSQSSKGIQITSNSSTELDCKDWKRCSWFWDKDNFTISLDKITTSNRIDVDFPGQHGFYSTDSKFLRKVKDRMGAVNSKFSFPNSSKKRKSGKEQKKVKYAHFFKL